MSNAKNLDKRDIIQTFLNAVIFVLVCVGTVIMYLNKTSGTGLTASGLENLKYFTVLSNIFCGLVALCGLILHISGKQIHILPKLMSTSAVGLTFFIIAAFLQPLYPDMNMYKGGNLFFHLIVPLLAMAEFIIMRIKEKIPFRYAAISAVCALIYGTGYLANILINGIGEWPDTNDWYGFLNWGYPVGIMIFAVIVLMNFGFACLLRFLNDRVNRMFT